MNLEMKKRLLRWYLWNVLLCGCEIWTIRKKHRTQLKILKYAMEKNGENGRVNNEEILIRVKENRTLKKSEKGSGTELDYYEKGILIMMLESTVEEKKKRVNN